MTCRTGELTMTEHHSYWPRKRRLPLLLLLSLWLAGACTNTLFTPFSHASYTNNADVQAFIKEMTTEHQYDAEALTSLFSQAKKMDSILKAMSRAPERRKTWAEYRKIFLTQGRIKRGKQFAQTYADALQRAEDTYGVAKEIIVAIIGIETEYGGNTGSYRVIDALATLGFYHPTRGAFFKKELKEALLLARENNLDIVKLKGSYAGAMGMGQFIPSSFRRWAVDFDQDGVKDIWENPVDAIGSVANYFQAHQWRKGESVILPARIENPDLELFNSTLETRFKVGELAKKGIFPIDSVDAEIKVTPYSFEGTEGMEYWIGLHNFYVITRYNRSRLYARAVYELSLEFSKTS